MNERIKLLISYHGLSASKFADVIGVQASGISHIISGRNKPGYDFIIKVLENFPDVNPDWLLLGKGEMLRTNAVEQDGNATGYDNDNLLFSSDNIEHAPEIPTTDSPQDAPSEPSKDLSQTIPSAVVTLNEVNRKKRVESVIIFYSDKSFSSYNPED